MSLFVLLVLLADISVAPRVPGASADPHVLRSVCVASDGGGFVAVYGSGNAGGSIAVNHVDARGEVLPAARLERRRYVVDLAGTRDGYLFAYRVDDGLGIITLRSDGTIAGNERVLAGVYAAGLASRGDRALVATSLGTFELLDTSGKVLRTGTFSASKNISPSVAANDMGFAIVWSSGAAVQTMVVSYDGDVVRTAESLGSSAAFYTSIASDGRSFMVVWAVYGSLYGMQLDVEGNALGTRALLATSASEIRDPHVAWDGRRYFVVYDNGSEAFTFRIGQSAEPLVSDASRRDSPRVAFSAAGTLLVWRDVARCTDAARVSGLLDGRPLFLSPGDSIQSDAAVALLANGVVTAWIERSDRDRVRVLAAGRTTDLTDEAIWYESPPLIASSGNGALVIWREWSDACSVRNLGAFVDASGVVTKITTIPIGWHPSLSWNGNEYVAVSTSGSNGVRVTFISESGEFRLKTAKPDEPVNLAAKQIDSTLDPWLVQNGDEYLLVRVHEYGSFAAVSHWTVRTINTQRLSRDLHPIERESVLFQGVQRVAAVATPVATVIVGNNPFFALLFGSGRSLIGDVRGPFSSGANAYVATNGREFAIVLGSDAFVLDVHGRSSHSVRLPEGAAATGIAFASDGRIVVAYSLKNTLFLHEISGPPLRRRAA